MNNGTSLLLMAVLVAFSAYFSATETAFSSLNRTRLRVLAEKGDKRAALACSLSEQYDKMLTSILIGNNIVNIALSSLCTLLFIHLLGDGGATVATAVTTVVVLVFGEVTPKSLAKESPERFAMFSAPFLRAVMWVLSPFAWLFSQLKKLVGRVVRSGGERPMTQEELLMLVDEVQQEGGLDKDEHELLRSAIEFTDRDAEDILTHRVDLEAVPADASPEEVARVFGESRFSRLLVYGTDIDDIVGVIHQSDFYADGLQGGKPLSALMTPPLFVPKSIRISVLLRLLQRKKAHIAVVTDGYGGTLGIVTMEDILEELVGEIWDEHDEIVEEFKRLPDGSCRVQCGANLDDLLDIFGLKKEYESVTVNGWVLEEMGTFPQPGDTFDCEHLHVTVEQVDKRRVTQILVEPREKPETEE